LLFSWLVLEFVILHLEFIEEERNYPAAEILRIDNSMEEK
jgi:hypothetical protein